jgi:xanthine dehydrogenase iron-sulfur cluster and FAD-binding subunit A
VVGGIYSLPKRIPELERYLDGKTKSDIEPEQCKKIIGRIPLPLPHIKFSKEYRRSVTENLVLGVIQQVTEE